MESDDIPLATTAGQDLAVSIYVAAPTGPANWHVVANQTSYVSPANHSADVSGSAFDRTTSSWFFLDAVSTRSTTSRGTIVALGDSITDGVGSSADTNSRWTDRLSDRLASRTAGPNYAVANEGIAGNLLLQDTPASGQSAVHRLDADVFARHDVTYVVVLEGINDLFYSKNRRRTADELISGYQQIIARAHARGIRVIGGTLLPVEGIRDFDAALEDSREKVNRWIMTGAQFDGVIDFARAVADPADPRAIRDCYHRGDHVHPNPAGYQALANSIDLSLFSR